MEYGSWQTHFQMTKKQLKEEHGKDLDLETYIDSISKYNDIIMMQDASHDKLLVWCEQEWVKQNKPYYRIHSNIIAATERMKVDGIEVSMLDIPKKFVGVELKFPIGYEINSMFCCRLECERGKFLFLCAQLNNGNRLMSSIESAKSAHKTIQETLDSYDFAKQGTSQDDIRVYKNMLRFLCLIKFLSDVPDENLMEYDVLSKDKGEFELACSNDNAEKKKEYIRKAKEKNKIGWNIGVNQRLLGPVGRLSETVKCGEGRELEYAHIRCGHLHAVRYGFEKKLVKVMFFKPTVVKPELPFKNELK